MPIYIYATLGIYTPMTKKEIESGNTRIQLSKGIVIKLKHFKGSRTWNELFETWINHFEGFSGKEEEVRIITNGDWDNFEKRITNLEEKTQNL